MLIVLAIASMIAGAIASIAGFGIGSVLTPTFGLEVPANIAVAAVSIPHLGATSYRLWLVRDHIDIQLLRSFGAMSAVGGLAGAGLGSQLASRSLEVVLAILLLFVGIGGLGGWTKRIRFTGLGAWLAGLFSGFLGGMVGNQGGLRAGAMTGLGVSRDAFVATATATGLIVDIARMPVYFATRWRDLLPLWPEILVMTVAVVIGTVLGMKLLRRIPETWFLNVVSLLLIGLGVWLILKPG